MNFGLTINPDLEINKDYAEAYYFIGLKHYLYDENTKAIEFFNYALEIDASHNKAQEMIEYLNSL